MKNFSHFSQIQQMTGQATVLELHRLTSPGVRYASRTAQSSCQSPACTHPLCKHFVFEPGTIVPALLMLSTWKALLAFTHHSNTIRNNFKWLCCRPRTFLLKKKFASKLCEHLMGWQIDELSWDWQWGVHFCWLLFYLSAANSDRNVREASTLGKLLPACKKLQYKQFLLVPSCKESSKSIVSRCSNQCFQFTPVHKPNMSWGWLVHPLYTFTYDLLYTDFYCVRNALPRRLLRTSKIKKQYSRPILNNFYHKNPIS